MSQPIRILVADDHPMIRDGLRAVLGTQDELEIVGEAATGDEAVRLCAALRPDLLLLDLEMPGPGGPEVISRVLETSPSTRVIVFTAFDRDEQIVGAVRAGAEGYLLKGAPREEIFRAVRVVHAGGSMIEPMVASRLIRGLRDDPDALTPRETEVLGLMSQGRSNRAIARALFISERTVKFHIGSILSKLGAENRTQAAALARERGLLPL